MADESDVEIIEQRLATNSSYFNSLLELIPAKYYFAEEDEEKKGKFFHNRSQKAPKQVVKENTKKAKRLKLDPSQNKTVSQIQAERAAESKEKDEIGGKTVAEGETSINVENVASTSLDDLRSRLESRIVQFRSKRKADSSQKHHERPKKRSKKEIKERNQAKGKTTEQNNNVDANGSKNSSQVLNDKGEVVFSKFDFTNVNHAPKTGSNVGKFKQLLAKAEKKQKKLQELKETDSEKAMEVQQQIAWKGALEKAEGIKQRDDPKLLKKTLKKKEKQKTKSKKDWSERKQDVQSRIEDKQKKREKNLKERKESKKPKGTKGKGKGTKGKGTKGKKGGRKPGF